MEKETKIKNSVNVRNIYDFVILNLVLYPGTDFFGNILKNEMPCVFVFFELLMIDLIKKLFIFSFCDVQMFDHCYDKTVV